MCISDPVASLWSDELLQILYYKFTVTPGNESDTHITHTTNINSVYYLHTNLSEMILQ